MHEMREIQAPPRRGENSSMFGKSWERVRKDEGQGVSEYAMLLVLLVLIVVATVHALGTNAQHVIDRVNTALHG
jgi:Flp pilus assembly pilin Flp